MTNEATIQYRRECLYVIGFLESITADVRRDYEAASAGSKQFTWGHVGEMKDIYRTLSDIEDRLYRKGEYAPENVATLGGGK